MIQFNFETRLNLMFKIIRLIDDRFEASMCDLDILLTINNKNGNDEAKTRLKAIKMWVENFVDGCLCYDAHTKLDTNILTQVTNYIMMCPDEPHDHMLLMLLHSKLTTLGGDDVIILESSLNSDTGEGFSCSVRGPVGDSLPNMSEWMGERHFHKQPWWYREDSGMLDMRPEDDEDLSIIPQIGDDIIQISRDTNIIENTDFSKLENNNIAEIIRPKFKPHIIENHD